MKTRLCSIVVMVCAVATCQSGEFVNLTFDEPDLSHVVNPDAIAIAPAGEALRGWTLDWESPGEFPLEWVGVKYGGAPLGLEAMGWPPWSSYRLYVTAHWSTPDGPLRPALHMWQVGSVPIDAGQLLLHQSGFWVAGTEPVLTYINGQIQYDLNAPGVPAFSAIDISPFAGQEVRLEFVFPSGPNQYHTFDIFGFVVIPEPSVRALLVGGGVGLWLVRRKR